MKTVQVTLNLTPELLEVLQDILVQASHAVTEMDLELIPIKTASELTGYSESYLRNLCRRRKIDFLQPSGPGGKIFFTKEALKNFINRNPSKPRRGRPRKDPRRKLARMGMYL